MSKTFLRCSGQQINIAAESYEAHCLLDPDFKCFELGHVNSRDDFVLLTNIDHRFNGRHFLSENVLNKDAKVRTNLKEITNIYQTICHWIREDRYVYSYILFINS